MSISDSGVVTSEGLQSPDISEFSEFPASWYRLCSSDAVRGKPFARDVFDRRLVAYRDQTGDVVVMDAICSHLGADLGLGNVVGDCIECPFHGWKYGSDGRCREVPCATSPPDFAAQRVFPCEERHGSVYFFNGPEPTFPLPFFLDEAPQDYCSIDPRGFTAPCSWYMVNAHAFDVQHFLSVHGRRLLEPLEVDTPAPFARRSSYLAEVLGENYYDRILRWVINDRVRITLTIWGGTFAVVTGDFGKRKSRFFVISEPLSDGHTRCEVLVFTPRISSRIVGPVAERLMLHIRRWLTTAYLRDENSGLGSPSYNPLSLTENDHEMVKYFQWAAKLNSNQDNQRCKRH
ncbi:MAG TPA: hypothetical protein DCG12_06190 [Planctomycetaceae bacterium]|nr:hypothetical protein [Planctomycetaceae bacterium]